MADKNVIGLLLSNGQLNKTTEFWKIQNLTLQSHNFANFYSAPFLLKSCS